MSIYNINFTSIWRMLYPPVLRKLLHLEWGNVVVKPQQYLNDNVLVEYKIGATYSIYDPSYNYLRNERVIGFYQGTYSYSNRGVYECIATSSIGEYPYSSTMSWFKTNDIYIGADERVRYNSQRILFEWALNQWFMIEQSGLTYSYGDSNGIYIESNDLAGDSMLMNRDSFYSIMWMSRSNDPTVEPLYLVRTYSSGSNYNFTIYVPSSVYNSLKSPEYEIRGVADKYIIAGILYEVVFY